MQSKIAFAESDPDDQRIAAAIERYQEHGVLWIEDLFSRDYIREIAEYYHEKYTCLSKSQLESRYAKVGDRRYMISVNVKGPLNCPALYANHRLMPILQNLLGPQCVISSFGSVIAFPGAAAQNVHFDYPPLFECEETCVSLPPHAITLVVPLIDLTAETGSTAVWFGSHRRLGARDELQRLAQSGSLDGSVCQKPKMGDAFLMDFRMIHAGTPNIGDQARPILYIVYSRPWFREDLNFTEQPPIAITKKQLRKVPKKWRHVFAFSRT
ncbi:MAG: hypothetical protein HKN47_28980 [Pirellulaceae bacterium]|nr:hypothetical protein [Pirellulaceae bacterium]